MGRVAAALAAAAGIGLYAAVPGVGSYQASVLLTVPAVVLLLVWVHRRLPLPAQWALAVPMAMVGPVGYLVWGGPQWWNWGQLTPLPLVLLILRGSRNPDDEPRPYYDGMADGVWGPP